MRTFGLKLKYLLIYDRVSESVQNFCANHSIDEVYNTKFLDIVDYVNVEVRRSLKKFAPNNSIEIWNIFLPKPDVPPAIAQNYREVKVRLIHVLHPALFSYIIDNSMHFTKIEWTKQLVAEQQQKTERIEKETQKMKAILDAERKKEVDAIEIEKDIQREEGKRNATKIRSIVREPKYVHIYRMRLTILHLLDV